MSDRFPHCMTFVFGKEGGYVDDPDDRGGPTNMGITLATLRSWRRDPTLVAADVARMSRGEAQTIYREWFWEEPNFHLLPPGLDLLMFDFGVNSGPERATKFLQDSLGVEPDGKVGPITIEAAWNADRIRVIDEVCDARLAFMRGLTNWWKYKNGWTDRVAKLRAQCKVDAARPVVTDPGVVATGAATAGAAGLAQWLLGDVWATLGVVAAVLVIAAGIAYAARRKK